MMCIMNVGLSSLVLYLIYIVIGLRGMAPDYSMMCVISVFELHCVE